MLGVYAGSFDPFTNGHMEVVTHAANVFDRIVVLIADNPGKKHWFSASERRDIVTEAVAETPNAVADVLPPGETAVEYAYRLGACLVRGLGDFTDYPAEKTLQDVNSSLRPEVQTVFLMTRRAENQMRSSSVRGAACYRFGWRSIRDAVPRATFNAVILKSLAERYHDLRPLLDSLPFSRFRERPYHGLEHIAYMIDLAEEWRVFDGDVDRLSLLTAIVFHDVFVDSDADVDAGDDVRRSVALFMERYSHQDAPPDIVRMVQATDHKDFAFGSGVILKPDEEIMIRLDLAILGDTPYEYARYAKSIREEYAPKYGYLSDGFRKGRAAFLETLLMRLQDGVLINSALDKQAGVNARWELGELEKGH